jgi:hypothetical protein
VCTEAGRKSGTTRAWRRFERRPAAQEVTKAARIVVLTPLQNVGEVVFPRPGPALGVPDCGAAQARAVFDKVREGAQRGALGGERGELVTVWEEACALECGIGGGVVGPAGGQRCTVRGPGERRDGKEHEAIILAQCGDNGPLVPLTPHSHGCSVEPRAQGLPPRVDRFRAVLEDQPLSSLSASRLEADIVFGIRPGEAHEGRKGFGGLGRPGSSPSIGDRGAKAHACWRSAKA